MVLNQWVYIRLLAAEMTVEGVAGLKEKNRIISGAYVLKYTLMMGVFFVITFLWFIYYGRSFVWGEDGFCQHYTALVYYGEYLRDIVRSLLVDHRLEIPLWDMDIGYGSDILSTLHYYVMGDPFNILSVLVPSSGMEYLYGGLILLRIYLAGLSFSAFLLSRRRQGDGHGQQDIRLAVPRWESHREGLRGGRGSALRNLSQTHREQEAVLLGSACYCFCGYVLNVAVRHPYFINPMIYLPLLLLGVDRIYQRRRPALYIVSVALAGISNFYFFYMLGLLVVLYAVVRYLEIFGGRSSKSLFCAGKSRGGVFEERVSGGGEFDGEALGRGGVKEKISGGGEFDETASGGGVFWERVSGESVLGETPSGRGACGEEVSGGTLHGKSVLGIKWRELFAWIGRFTVYSLIGIAMAAIVLVPVVMSMYGTDRIGVDFYIPLWYPDSYYKELFLQFTGGGKASHYSYLGYSALGFLALVVLYFRREENTLLKILFPVMTIFLFVPYIGHIFNGFSYRTNRWIFAYSLLVACIVARAVPVFFSLRRREKLTLAVISLLYGMFCLYLSSESGVVAEVLLLAVCCSVVCVLEKISGKWQQGILLSLLGVCTFFQAFYLYTPAGEDYQGEFIALGQCFQKLVKQAPEAAVCQVMGEDSACRFDRTRKVSISGRGIPQNNNEAMAIQRHGTGYYFSLDNPGVSDFLREMQLNTTSYHRYSDLDSRNILETLSSVKYVLAKEGQTEKIPCQYQENEVCHQGNFVVYQAETALPVGYTYKSYIPRALYDTLSVVEKQQALLQGCVLEDSSFPAEQPDFCHCPVSCTMEAGKGTVLENGQKFRNGSQDKEQGMGSYSKQSQSQQQEAKKSTEQDVEALPAKHKITVKKKGACVALQCEKTVPGELYVIFSGLKYQYKEKNQARIRIRVQGKESVLNLKNNRNNFYAGIDDFLVNLGDFEEPVTEIKLLFADKGSYSYEGISVVSQPMEKQIAYAKQCGKEVLEHVTFPTNQIRGDISLTEDRILFLAVPYSTGWEAWVDGKETEIKRANTFGMAMELTRGKHQVKLVYHTPYLMAGMVVSALGCVCFFVLLLYNRKRCFNSEEAK